MRRLILAAALSLFASSALAQPAATRTVPTDPLAAQQRPVAPQPALPPDVSTVAADLSGLNTQLEQDEVTLTRLRDAEYGRENAVLRAIRPALKFHGRGWFPLKY